MSVHLRRGLGFALFAALGIAAAFVLTGHEPVRAATDGVEQVEVSARPIRTFRIGSDGNALRPARIRRRS